MISVFDIFKVGVGPSSSHTVGPMKADKQFIDDLCAQGKLEQIEHIRIDVYGSLSMTGLGHGTDTAIIMGLAGYLPHNVDIDSIPTFVETVKASDKLAVALNKHEVRFQYAEDMVFHNDFLPLHENGMIITAFDKEGKESYRQTYYSIGGGFIVDEAHFGVEEKQTIEVPFPYKNAKDIIKYCNNNGLSISKLMYQNEVALHGKEAVEEYLQYIWQTMSDCMQHGLITEGVLPGPLKVVRRAAGLHRWLSANKSLSNDPMQIIDWVNMYALAVSEENAAGGRVVTAQTNGACGVVPAVLMYYDKFVEPLTPEIINRYNECLYFGSGSRLPRRSWCSLFNAAAGLAEILGGTPERVCSAAEVAMEHSLGLTCDPVGGQVQVPCIERNAISSVKAINAARMALRRASTPCVDLDEVIDTMYETGKDMDAKYRETSRGGLAIKIVCN